MLVEEPDYNAMRKNPELFRKLLHDVLEQLAAGMPETKVICYSANNGVAEDMSTVILPKFKKIVQDIIDETWTEMRLAKKIKELELNPPPDYVAWRPITGETHTASLKVHYLKMVANWLANKINKTKIEVETLEKIINKKRAMLKNSQAKIEQAEKNLLNINYIN